MSNFKMIFSFFLLSSSKVDRKHNWKKNVMGNLSEYGILILQLQFFVD